jgi:hypothetical protein
MGAPWSRVVNSTIKKYIREREINILRNRKLTALLKKKDRISFNWSGISMDWKVKYKRVRLTPYADGDTLEFSRKDRNKTAGLDWRGYSATDSMTKGEFLMNRNTEAIIKLYSEISSDLIDDMEDAFGEEAYINGYAVGNSKRVHGIESFFNGATNTGANIGNGNAQPTATYAGLSTVPGAYGGQWDSGTLPAWPNGRGDAQFDFWSPLAVDYGDILFSGNTSGVVNANSTWANNCVEAISYGIIKTKKSKSAKGQLDLILTDDEMYRQYVKVMRQKERILVERSADKSPLIALGFSDVINQDGTDVTWEYGIPYGTGYGLNCDMMEIRSQQAQLFVPEGPDQDIASKSWRFSVDFFGNFVFNPKFFLKLWNYTNSSDAV